jgi:guanine deaminase
MSGDAVFLRQAIALAEEKMRAEEGGPFGALVVSAEGVVVALGWNRVTSSNDPTAHAVVSAIRTACATLSTFKLEGCVLYSSCEPCPMCLAAAYWAGVARIVFAAGQADAAAAGFDDAFLYREIVAPIGERSIPTQQLLPGEGKAPFDAWLAKEDRVPY